jgi:hypothetical protein
VAKTRSRPYARFVADFARLLARGRRLPLGRGKPPRRPKPAADAPLALIFAPHPDDECLMGALPLRLQRERGWRVAAVPVTLGSRLGRRAARLNEFRAACASLGWDAAAPAGRLADLLRRLRPALILFPHAGDKNSTHRKVHRRVLAALKSAGPDFRCMVAETEFWGALEDPNLLVQVPTDDAADLIAALSCHQGEVARNPYHVLLPSWLSDNVRRGGELVGGQGARAPRFDFAVLYRLSRWNGRALVRSRGGVVPAGKIVLPG